MQRAGNYQEVNPSMILMKRKEGSLKALSPAEIAEQSKAINFMRECVELIVEVHKVEKTPDGMIGIYRADFTPWHGEFNRWRGDYKTIGETEGRNPFHLFKGDTVQDHVFHNIAWNAVGVVVGEAMKRYGANIAWVATTDSRLSQSTRKSGGAFKKKVTTTIKGHVKPKWFVATPLGLQQGGGTTAICLGNLDGSNNLIDSINDTGATVKVCKHPELVAYSGVTMNAWEGGNMFADEEVVYSWVKKQSGFSMVFFTIVTALVTWGVASAVIAASGTGAGLGVGAGVGASAGSGTIAGLTALKLTALTGGLYAGLNLIQGTGFTEGQPSWGTDGEGTANVDLSKAGEHQRNLGKAVRNVQVGSVFGTGLTSVKELYQGDCDKSLSRGSCLGQGKSRGIMHRADHYQEVNPSMVLIKRKEECLKALSPAEIAEQSKAINFMRACVAPEGIKLNKDELF